jgi:hypothetical protein
MIRPDLTDRGFLMWAAAWLDTEGSIGLYRAGEHKRNPGCFSYTAVLKIAQVVAAPLEILKCAFGGSFTYDRPCRALHICSQQALAMLRLTRPYLVVKGAQADLVLLAGSIKARRRRTTPADAAELEAIKQQLHVLNNSKPEHRQRMSLAKSTPEQRQRQSESVKRHWNRKRHVRLLQTV